MKSNFLNSEKKNATHIIEHCILFSNYTKVILLYDSITEEIKDIFKEILIEKGKKVTEAEIEMVVTHGVEPDERITKKALKADVIICLTKCSLAHTRLRQKANQAGIGFLSMPDYDHEILLSEAVTVNYFHILDKVENTAHILTSGKEIRVKNPSGTDLYMNIDGRIGNCCPGFVKEGYLLGSPPDIEANIAPVETDTKGIISVNGSITDQRLGKVEKEVILLVENGKVIDIKCSDKNIEKIVKTMFEEIGSEQAYVVAECGIGFNEKASLCGNMLIDEGAFGHVHFGIGSNWTIGGKNKVSFHMDFVIKEPTVYVDNILLIDGGKM